MIESARTSGRVALEKRESEILRIMRQMKSDKLQQSAVFTKLKQELQELKLKMIQGT